MSRPELGNILNILQQTSQPLSQLKSKISNWSDLALVPFTTTSPPNAITTETTSLFTAVIRFFGGAEPDQRSDIFVCELRGKIIEWQSHISVRTLSSHFHYLNGPIMWELKLLRYTSLFYTQLSLCPPLPPPCHWFLQTRPELRPMKAREAFCLIMIVLSLSRPAAVFEHGPLMYSFLRQH